VNNVPGEKPHDIVPRELQREAIDWLARNVLEAPLWLYPKNVVGKLGVDYADEIRNRQQTIIAMMLSPNAIMNLQSSQYASEKAYSVDEYFNDIFDAVWKPLSDKDEENNSFRRLQQRSYVDFLGMAINGSTGSDGLNTSMAQRSDAVLYIEMHLDKVENYLKNVSQQPSTLNALHYKDLLLRVKKIRERHESGK
jgi:hypothetical protein